MSRGSEHPAAEEQETNQARGQVRHDQSCEFDSSSGIRSDMMQCNEPCRAQSQPDAEDDETLYLMAHPRA